MAFTYIKKFSKNSVPNVVHSDPYWILAVLPFKNRVTVDMAKISDLIPYASKEGVDGMLTNPLVVLDNHCVSWTVNASKSSYVHSSSFTLVPPAVVNSNGELTNITQYDIGPQDWVFFWAMDNKEDYERVKKNLYDYTIVGPPQSGYKSLNGVNDGLKFVGRVASFRMNGTMSSNGVLMHRYTINAHAFNELNNIIYFNPLVYENLSEDPNTVLADLGGAFGEFLKDTVGGVSYITTQTAIPKLLRIFYNSSLASGLIGQSSIGKKQGNSLVSALNASPNTTFMIPHEVPKILGVNPQKLTTYLDSLYVYVGTETHRTSNPDVAVSTSSSTDFSGYWGKDDTIAPPNKDTFYSFKRPLNSQIVVQVPHFDGRSVWSILSTYANTPVNEMYTTLRISPDNKVMPSFVCRKNPLVSEQFASSRSGTFYTRYTEIPRWKIESDGVMSYDIGLNDSLDVNYLLMQPSFSPLVEDDANEQLLDFSSRVPPFMDRLDIQRNGLRMKQNVLSALITPEDQEKLSKARAWSGMLADIMMRMKYSLNGTLTCKGIQEPIPVGDNVVFQNTLFHIEQVSHQGGIDMSGKKFFNTTLSLTFGLELKDNKESYDPHTYLKSPPQEYKE
jgi:hypothetical protein